MKPIHSTSDIFVGFGYGIGAAAVSAVIGTALVGGGKTLAVCGRFFKGHGSVVGTGLIAGLTTAAAVPLTKKSLEIYTPTYLDRYSRMPQQNKEYFHRMLFIGAANLLTTTLLIHRVTSFISGYSPSLPRRLGLGLTSALISGGIFGYCEFEIFQLQIPTSKPIPFKLLNQQDIEAAQEKYSLSEMIAVLYNRDYTINEELVAELIDHLHSSRHGEMIRQLMNQSDWRFEVNQQTYTLSPFVVIAHMDEGNRPLQILDSIQQQLRNPYRSDGGYGGRGSQPTEEDYRTKFYEMIGERGLKGRYDAKTFALILRECDPDFIRGYLEVIQTEQFLDADKRRITRGDVEVHFPPTPFINLQTITDALRKLPTQTAQGIGHVLSAADRSVVRQLLDYPELDPLLILAYYSKVRDRNALFQTVDAMQPYRDKLDQPAALMQTMMRRHDPKVWAMFLDQMSPEKQSAALEALQDADLTDADGRPVTLQMIQAEMTPLKPPRVEVITKKDLLTTGVSALGTLAISVAALSALILMEYSLGWLWARKSATLTPFKWGWSQTKQGWANHPALKGVVATAITAGSGYGTGIIITGSDRVAKVTACIFGVLAAPSLAKHYFSYEMGKGEALTSALAGLLLHQEGPTIGVRRNQRSRGTW